MTSQQVGNTAASAGAPIEGGVTERGDIAGNIGADNERRSGAQQFNQVGPVLVGRTQQALNATARRLGFMRIIGAKLAEQLAETIALAFAEVLNDVAMSSHAGTPAQLRQYKGLASGKAVTA